MKKQKTFFICDRCEAVFERYTETSICFNGKFGFMKKFLFQLVFILIEIVGFALMIGLIYAPNVQNLL